MNILMVFILMNSLNILSHCSLCHLRSPFFGLLFILSACENDNHASKLQDVHMTIVVDTLVYPDCYLRSAFQSTNQPIAIIEDNSSNTNLMYNLSSRAVLDSLFIRAPWVAGRLINSSLFPYLEWLDSNHIMFEDLNVPEGHPEFLFIYNVSGDSIVFQVPTSIDSTFGLSDLIFSFYSYCPPAFFEDKVVGHVVQRNTDHSDPHYAHSIGEINPGLKTATVYDVKFPYDEPKGDYAFIKEYYTCNANNTLILSTSLSNTVVVYDLRTHTSDIRLVKSQYHQPIQLPEKIPNTDKTDLDALEDQHITTFQYLPLYYDPYRNLYYRGYKRAQKLQLEDGRYATQDNKITGMILLDDRLKPIGEYTFANIDSRAFQYASAITSMGLTLQTRINDTTHVLKTYQYEP